MIIATHSRPNLLPRAIESAQRAGRDVEVIVVDDASTDNTSDVCRGLKGIRYVRLDRNQGVAGARNVGILASSSDYVTFLDDDDVRLAGSLELQLDCLEAAPGAGLVYGQVLLGNGSCIPTGQPPAPVECPQGDIFWELLGRNFIPCLSVVFRKSCIYRVGLLDKDISRIDDWDLWVRIAELYPVVAIEEPVAIWRTASPESGQGTSDIAGIFSLAARVQTERWFALPRADRAAAHKREQARRRLLAWASDMLIWTASYELKRGHSGFARKNVLTALRLNPLRTLRPWTFQILGQSYLPSSLIGRNRGVGVDGLASLPR